ncbi:hypothetical protein [Methanosarcina lacustris]|uniref:hypothetical protein n=1 Tax=Methanosarcina lacustris TaxID=170861 RepID=UPI000AC81FA8|nr:hypothetical protein [Methanosarcina lacustris]
MSDYKKDDWFTRIAPRQSFVSGSQEIGDFLGVALQVQQHEVLFAALKRTT